MPYHHYYRENPQQARHDQLNAKLDHLRKHFAGIGTKKAKIRLNKLTSPNAKILRLMMEIEDANIRAKRYQNEWRASMYEKKHEHIESLIDLYNELGLMYGVQESDVNDTSHIIYFDFLNHQISWHFDAECSTKKPPQYHKEWDGIRNTYQKLESIYNELFNTNLFSSEQ